MTEATSADSLLTDTPPPATKAAPPKLDTAVIDPAAALDKAAQLDPAKVSAPKPKRAKRTRVRKATRAKKQDAASTAAAVTNTTKAKAVKAAASHAAAARDDGRAAYVAAVAHEVASFADLPEGTSLDLRLADGDEFVEGVLTGVCADIQPAAQGATYVKDIDIGPDGPPVRVSEAWLIAASGEAVRCAVGPLTGGGGYHAKIPAGHLKF